VVPPPASRDLAVRFDWLCFAATVGAVLTVAVVAATGLLGLAVFGGASIGIAAAIGILTRCLLPRRAWTLPSSPPEGRWPLFVSRVVLAAALAIFAWKVHRVPLWSWDHYSVWGMKARHLAEGGFLNLSFLRVAPFRYTNPEYPIGLPVLWRILTLGRTPAWPDFKVCHVLFGVATVGLFRLALRAGGVSSSFANAAAAFVAASPLYWDTESLGLAEMPLAAAILAAAVLLLRRREDPGERPPAWLLGFLLGSLPWIKQEGLSLAVLLLAASWVLGRSPGAGRRPPGARAVLALSFLVTAGPAIALDRALPPGQPFLQGEWMLRFSARLPHVLRVLGKMGEELVASDWIGFWPVFLLAAAYGIWRRDRRVAALSAVVAAQTALYLFIYLGTYLDPAAHIRSSFFRIMSALLPLAAVAAVLSAAPDARDARGRT
ncbi:MAG TPA: hypothetical protein VMQ61_16695, partial [Thermoanaerobaculia bacterium]|nr:hypothetical protein [Thermoanaerobaculia bacterium]